MACPNCKSESIVYCGESMVYPPLPKWVLRIFDYSSESRKSRDTDIGYCPYCGYDLAKEREDIALMGATDSEITSALDRQARRNDEFRQTIIDLEWVLGKRIKKLSEKVEALENKVDGKV